MIRSADLSGLSRGHAGHGEQSTVFTERYSAGASVHTACGRNGKRIDARRRASNTATETKKRWFSMPKEMRNAPRPSTGDDLAQGEPVCGLTQATPASRDHQAGSYISPCR